MGNYFRQLLAYREQLYQFLAKEKSQSKKGPPHSPMFLHGLVSVFFDAASAFYIDLRDSNEYNQLSERTRNRLKLFYAIAHVQSCLSILLKHRSRRAALDDPALAECWNLICPLETKDPKEMCTLLVCYFSFIVSIP